MEADNARVDILLDARPRRIVREGDEGNLFFIDYYSRGRFCLRSREWTAKCG